MPNTANAPTAEALFRQGLDLLRRRRWNEAAAILGRVVEVQPDGAEALHHLGVTLAEQGRQDQALDCFDRALRLQPAYPPAHHNRGNALRKLGRLAEAVAAYEEALRLDPEATDVCNNLGITLLALGRPADAAARFRQALRLRPDHADAANNLGVALAEQGHLAEAEAVYRQVLRRRPHAAQTHNNLGIALAAQRRYGEAIACYRRALRLSPDYPDAHNNLGNALRQEGQTAEAAAALEQALRLQPDYPEAHNNLAIVRIRQGSLDEALAGYAEALRLKPDYAEAHCNRALAWLLQGDFEKGWPEYEWRWRTRDFKPRAFDRPRWDGGPLEGRSILLWAEQGLGDTLQFVRYAALVKQRGGTVLLEAPPRLLPLLRRCAGIDHLLPAGGPPPDFDVQAPLLSLPGLLGTTLANVPAAVPYLSADPEWVRRWREDLRAVSGFRVGIAWQGSRTYREDRFRSVPLKHFAPLARLEGVRLVSLQKGPGLEQLDAVRRSWNVLDLGPRLDEAGGAFVDTAAVMACLDLVVTSDTAIAHLAGALGVPVWVALPEACDWRWLRERADCPWYPTMRLFRQRCAGDWDEVFGRIADELRRQRPVLAAAPGLNGNAATEAVALRRQGDGLCRQGRFREAVGCLRRALLLEPGRPAVHNNLGVTLARLGQWAEAAAAYREALRLRPDYAAAEGNLGEALFNQGRHAEAIACYRRALQLDPRMAPTHNNLGVALAAQGQMVEACHHYREALGIDPAFVLAHHNLAVALEKLGQNEEAEAHYRRALEAGPADPTAWAGRGRERVREGKLVEAVACFRAALQRRPEDAEAHHGLAQALAELWRLPEAVAAFHEASRRQVENLPHGAEVLHNLGDALRRLGRPQEAEDAYRQALRRRPAAAATHNHLGIALIEQGRPLDAEACFRDSLRCDPRHAQAYNNLGVALEQQGRVDEAIAAYRESLRWQPEASDTHKNLALAWLLSGNFADGWPRYEWRWQCNRPGRRTFTQPRWDGGPLEGRTILLWAEQGLGDTLQFVRYAPLVRRRGGFVLLEAPPPLVPLLKRCPGIDRVLPAGGSLPDFDVQAPLLSLPGLFRTTLDTIPDRVPYLSAEPERLRRWGEELRPAGGFKIGIAWQGSPTYGGDRHRSIPLKHFAPLTRLPGVRLVSLQKKAGAEQLATVAGDWGVLDLGPRLDEDGAFLDTAAVMAHLDLIVTSDTAIPHLAGALGVEVWMALPVARDWRWLLDRSDSPWYPTMRLFRQRRAGDWDEVFNRIAAEVVRRQRQAALRRPLRLDVSPGALLDRIGALEVQRRRAADAGRLIEVCAELGGLIAARARGLREWPELAEAAGQVRAVHEEHGTVEDGQRARLERRVNECCGWGTGEAIGIGA